MHIYRCPNCEQEMFNDTKNKEQICATDWCAWKGFKLPYKEIEDLEQGKEVKKGEVIWKIR